MSRLPSPPACPICGKSATEARLLPFCSARCAEVDLGRWLQGRYVVPGNEPAPGEDDEGG